MKTRQTLNLVALLALLVVNGLANSLPLNGRTTGEISDSFPVLFTPAGYVFSIWGLIYFLLSGFAIYQAMPAQRNNPRLQRIGYWFVANAFFNSAWIFLWHYGLFPLTLLAMLALLATLLVIYLRLDIGLTRVSKIESVLVNLPFSVYLGWISVATIANFSVVLYDLGWNGGGIGPEIWTMVMLGAATALGAAMILLRREIAYPLVLIWAFFGIAARQGDTPSVATASILAGGFLLILLGASLLRRRPAFAQNSRGNVTQFR